jgi:hypothetical protein
LGFAQLSWHLHAIGARGCWVDDLTFESAHPVAARDAIAIGPPSVLSTWVFDLLRQVCDLVPERAAARAIDREDQVEAGGERQPLIYLSHFPSRSLQAECGSGTAPILLCLDDPLDSVRYLQHGSNVSVVEALRLQTAAAASYPQLRGNPRLLILHRLAEAPAADIIDVVLDHLQIELTAEQRETLLQKHLGPEGNAADLESSLRFCVGGYEQLEEARQRFTPREIVMIGGVLAPLIQLSFREDAGPIVWPNEAFLSGDRPDTPASLVADLTGGARILYYGPYFCLPAGSWRARMIVGFSAAALGTPFSVEVFGGRLLAHATMVPESKGVFHGLFGFTHDDARQPLEVRIRTDRGAIEGRVAFGNVEFSPERLASD